MSDPSPVEAIFFAALEKSDPAARAAYLDGACAGRPELRARVDRLLAAHPRVGAFLEPPAAPGPGTAPAFGIPGTGAPEVPAPGTATFGGDDPDRTTSHRPTGAEVGAVLVGRYKLLQPIGEGGMGTVWMAEQTEPVKRRVAVKLIRTDKANSRAILARFEAERQAIALMDHPHIAKLLDAGTADSGRPYFVMELVKGVPLTAFCDTHTLSVPERLELFARICGAVQHAHQKGIIHRDLKPSNILVESHDGKPVPKVIDFGLAKAVTGFQLTEHTLFTGFGAVLGTPQYMAPEQAQFNSLDVDTRADIYALGAILYELLTGTTPLTRAALREAAVEEVLRLIREQEAPAPSSRLSSSDTAPSAAANRGSEPAKLGRFVKGELDWIVLKALSKDRDRRYETAGGFARDVERFLNHEPVTAGPAGLGYRLRKFVRRNRGPVLAAGLVAVALVGGVIGTALGLVEARRQEGLARDEADRKERALRAETLALAAEREQRQLAQQNEAKAKAAEAAERDAKVREAQERVNAQAAAAKTADVLDAMTSTVTGDSLATQQELSAEQKKFLGGVLAYYRELAAAKGDDPRARARTASAAYRVGMIEARLGRQEQAAAAFRSACAALEELAAEFPTAAEYRRALAASYSNWAVELARLDRGTAALEQYRKALTVSEKLATDSPGEPRYRQILGYVHYNLGQLLVQLGRHGPAREHFTTASSVRAGLATSFPDVPEYRKELAASHFGLGQLLMTLGERPEARRQHQKALELRKKLVAESPGSESRKELAESQNHLGNLLVSIGQPAEARTQFEQAEAILQALVAEFPNVPDYRASWAGCHVNLGVLTTGQPAQARDHFQKAVAVQEKLVAEFPRVLAYREDLAGSHNNLGNLLAALGQHTDAREHYRLGSALLEQLAAECPTVPAYRNSLARGYYNLANLLRDLKQGADAREPYQKALGLYERLAAESPTVPEYRAQLAHTYNNLGLCFTDLGRRAEAREQFQKALAVMEKLSAEFPDVPDYGVSLGGGYCNFAFGVLNGGQPAESLAWFDKAIRVLGPIQERNPLNFQARYFLRNCHSGRARALVQLQKFADSVTEWDKAVEFSPADQKRLFRAARATARAHAGAVADAVAEVAELTKSPFWGADQWYDFACVYALASAKLPDREKEYADKAMELLGQAVKAGYKDAAHLRADADLGALRGRDDFKALVAELEKKFPPKLERAPPPREK